LNLKTSLPWVWKTLKRPAFWIIFVLLSLITVIHYQELESSVFLIDFFTDLGLTRHALDRILYLAPITLAGYAFGWQGGIAVSLIALAAMIPRILLVSVAPIDALVESIAVFIIGNVLAMTFYFLRKEKEYRHELEEAQDKMHFYLGEVNKAQEEERKRISHELHDDTIQSLVALARNLELLSSQKTSVPDDTRRRLEELRQQTNNIMVGVRRLSQDLRPAALDRLGLLPALEWLVNDISRVAGVKINVKTTGDIPVLEKEKELVVFRIVQEALRNVWHHSGASAADVVIISEDDKIIIGVSDNGQGFVMPRAITDFPSLGKLGIVGMYERAQLIGGILVVQSEPGRGTRVSFKVAAP